jgi:hypothetical protein
VEAIIGSLQSTLEFVREQNEGLGPFRRLGAVRSA